MVKNSNWVVIKKKINGKILDFVKFKYLKIYEKFFY